MLIFIIQLKSKYTSFSRTQFLRSVSRFLKILVFTFTVSLGLLFHSRPIAFIQEEICILFLYKQGGFPGGSDGKETACNAGDLGLTSGLGRFPGEGHGNLLQDSGLENSMDRGGLQSTGLQRVRHDWATNTSFTYISRCVQKWAKLCTWEGPLPLSVLYIVCPWKSRNFSRYLPASTPALPATDTYFGKNVLTSEMLSPLFFSA